MKKLTDQELTKKIESTRIFGTMLTAPGVLKCMNEVTKIECENFLTWWVKVMQPQGYSGFNTFEQVWCDYLEYSQKSILEKTSDTSTVIRS